MFKIVFLCFAFLLIFDLNESVILNDVCELFPKTNADLSEKVVVLIYTDGVMWSHEWELYDDFLKCYMSDQRKSYIKAYLNEGWCSIDFSMNINSLRDIGLYVKKWEIIFAVSDSRCDPKKVKEDAIKTIQDLTFDALFVPNISFHEVTACGAMKCSDSGFLYIDPHTRLPKVNILYETIERYVDTDFDEGEPIGNSTYFYFYNPLMREHRNLLPAVLSIFLMLVFFILGIFGCVYSLVTFVLVEEDFRTRNDEREWLASVSRQQHLATPVSHFPDDSAPINTALSASTDSKVHQDNIRTNDTQSSETDLLLPQKNQENL